MCIIFRKRRESEVGEISRHLAQLFVRERFSAIALIVWWVASFQQRICRHTCSPALIWRLQQAGKYGKVRENSETLIISLLITWIPENPVSWKLLQFSWSTWMRRWFRYPGGYNPQVVLLRKLVLITAITTPAIECNDFLIVCEFVQAFADAPWNFLTQIGA